MWLWIAYVEAVRSTQLMFTVCS